MSIKYLISSFFLILCSGFFTAKAQNIITIAGSGSGGVSTDSVLATAAHITPYGVAVDTSGMVYFTDNAANKIRRFRVGDIITTFAGTGYPSSIGDSGLAINATLSFPLGITINGSGEIFFAEAGSDVIRKINTSGYIFTAAGNHTAPGFAGMGGPADSAKLNGVSGVAFDAAGNYYIADNNTRVLKVNTGDTINVFAGSGAVGSSGSGIPATDAALDGTQGVACDAAGNVYIADYTNSKVRKVDAAGIITDFAGNGSMGATGLGGPATAARINGPTDVKAGAAGNVYIAEQGNNRITKVDGAGIITRVAGTGTAGFSGDDAPATAAQLNGPTGIWIDDTGNIYIADLGNHRVREILHSTVPTKINTLHSSGSFIVYPQPNSGSFTVETQNMPGDAQLIVLNVKGQQMYTQKLTSVKTQISLAQPPGLYYLSVHSSDGTIVQKILIQ